MHSKALKQFFLFFIRSKSYSKKNRRLLLTFFLLCFGFQQINILAAEYHAVHFNFNNVGSKKFDCLGFCIKWNVYGCDGAARYLNQPDIPNVGVNVPAYGTQVITISAPGCSENCSGSFARYDFFAMVYPGEWPKKSEAFVYYSPGQYGEDINFDVTVNGDDCSYTVAPQPPPILPYVDPTIKDDNDLRRRLTKKDDCGMPVWSVSEPFISLWLLDEPLGYQPAVGPRVSFELSHKQRELAAGFDPNTFGVGKRWNCSWLSYVTSQAINTNTVFFRGGGIQTFSGTNFLTNARLTGDINSGFTLTYPDGSQDIFGYVVASTGSSPQRAFLTQIVNPQGQAITLNYAQPSSGVVQLQFVIDGDGRTNRIYYAANNSYSANLISHVVDPFSRTNFLAYNSGGDLTGVTDVAGNASSISYDDNHKVTSYLTPYGTTSFSYTEGRSSTAPNGRSILITRPDNSHELYLYTDAAANDWLEQFQVSTSPFTNYFDRINFNRRNSFHWGARQYANLSTTQVSSFTTADYRLAHMKHWLMAEGNNELGGIISREQEAGGLRTYYDYVDKTTQDHQGSQSSPSLILNLLNADGDSWVHVGRNTFGNVTDQTSTYSGGLRTVGYRYADNEIDLIAVTNFVGLVVSSNSYNSSHQILAHFDALNEKTSYTYNDKKQVSSIVQPNGLVTTNIFGDDNFLAQQIVVGFSTNSYTYANDLIHTHTDTRGLTTTSTWENLNRLVSTAFPDGSYIYNIYNKLDLAATRDRLGNWSYFGYDSMQRNTTITNALGNVTINSYCTCGALDSVLDAGTNLTQFFYDIHGNLLRTVYADGFSVTNAYNIRNQIKSSSDSSGSSSSYTYNLQGLVTTVSNNVGLVAANVYNIHDWVTSATNANGVSVTTAYDTLGRPVSRSYPDGGVEQFGYTPNVSSMTSHTDRLNNITLYGYDLLGRKTNEVSVGVTTNSFVYNGASDMLALTDGRGQTTTWNYDAFGRVTNKLDASGIISFAYQYDANDRLTNRWTPAKGNTGYAYDALGNRTNINYGGNKISFAFDALGRMTNMQDGLGTSSFRYSIGSQLLSVGGLWSGDTVAYTYTNRMRSGLSVGSWSQTYGYDSALRLTNVTSPAGSFGYAYNTTRKLEVARVLLPNTAYITNNYDGIGRVKLAALANSSGHVLDGYTYDYDLAGQRTNVLRDFGLTTSTASASYDPIGQLTSWKAKEANGAARLNEQLGYAYDAAGNLKLRTNNVLIQTLAVDAANALTNITRTGSLTVDGNTPTPASSVTVNGQGAAKYADFTFASSNSFTLADGNNFFTNIAANYYGTVSVTNTVIANLPENVALQFDASGNLTNDGVRALSYDTENQLTNVTAAGNWRKDYLYDGMNRRRITRDYIWQSGAWALTNETRFIYDANAVVQEWDSNSVAQVSYTRGVNGLLARTDTNGSAFYHADGNHNITAMMDGSQYTVARYLYDPYGRLLGKWGKLADINTYCFSGKEYDKQAGIYYFGLRFYDSNLQRWLNRDPIEESGGFNLYGYVDNNPVAGYDEFGLVSSLESPEGVGVMAWLAEQAAAGAVAGAGAGAVAAVARQAGKASVNVPCEPWSPKEAIRDVVDSSVDGAFWGALTGPLFGATAKAVAPLVKTAWGAAANALGLTSTRVAPTIAASVANQASTAAEGGIPNFIYRTGSQTENALTDAAGVSFRDSISSSANRAQVFDPGAKIWAVDTSKLPSGSVVLDGNPAGHVSVLATPSEIQAAIVPQSPANLLSDFGLKLLEDGTSYRIPKK